jgi:hypothetical protein
MKNTSFLCCIFALFFLLNACGGGDGRKGKLHEIGIKPYLDENAIDSINKLCVFIRLERGLIPLITGSKELPYEIGVLDTLKLESVKKDMHLLKPIIVDTIKLQGIKHIRKKVMFPSGTCTLDARSNQALKNASNEIEKHVKRYLDGQKKMYQFYVYGSADVAGNNSFKLFQKDIKIPFPIGIPKSMIVYSYAGGAWAKYNAKEFLLNDPITNKDLPNYRALFALQILNFNPVIKKLDIHVLDGSVTSRVDSTDRNFKIEVLPE